MNQLDYHSFGELCLSLFRFCFKAAETHHSCLHFFGLHLSELTMAIRVSLSLIVEEEGWGKRNEYFFLLTAKLFLIWNAAVNLGHDLTACGARAHMLKACVHHVVHKNVKLWILRFDTLTITTQNAFKNKNWRSHIIYNWLNALHCLASRSSSVLAIKVAVGSSLCCPLNRRPITGCIVVRSQLYNLVNANVSSLHTCLSLLLHCTSWVTKAEMAELAWMSVITLLLDLHCWMYRRIASNAAAPAICWSLTSVAFSLYTNLCQSAKLDNRMPALRWASRSAKYPTVMCRSCTVQAFSSYLRRLMGGGVCG